MEKVRDLAPEHPRILDVGPAYETELLRALPAVVDTLGLADIRFPPQDGERHVQLDLRLADQPDEWPELDEYDVVVCAEVIEHVAVPPIHVLRLLAGALRRDGWLVLQTPNAAQFAKRLRLLAGRNPYEPLRDSSDCPGHIREYTVDELLALARESGLEVGGWLTANYFSTGTFRNRVLRRAGSLLPARLRAGITLWLRKPPTLGESGS
jgi:SAM-dependent methyltransferase